MEKLGLKIHNNALVLHFLALFRHTARMSLLRTNLGPVNLKETKKNKWKVKNIKQSQKINKYTNWTYCKSCIFLDKWQSLHSSSLECKINLRTRNATLCNKSWFVKLFLQLENLSLLFKNIKAFSFFLIHQKCNLILFNYLIKPYNLLYYITINIIKTLIKKFFR